MTPTTQSPLRVLALVPAIEDTSPGQRFRMEQWAPVLAAQGIELTFESFETPALHEVLYQRGHLARKAALVAAASARRLVSLFRARRYDAAYIFREAAVWGPAVLERVLALRGLPFVFDFDDAIFVRYASPSNGCLSYLKCPGKTRTLCRLAAHVMAGNEYLADYALQVNRHVTIVPTTIDTDHYRVRPASGGRGPCVIGWSGSYSTVQHLDTLRAVLQRLATLEPFRLRVIGTPEYRLEGVDVEALPWRAATEVEDLQAIDIGLMPLPDDAWSRGKCGLKALQYMALGIPTICSPVGVNSAIVTDGANGFLAACEDEWVAKLAALIHRPDLRIQVGLQGRTTVEARFSARCQAPVVGDILRHAAVGGRRNHGSPA